MRLLKKIQTLCSVMFLVLFSFVVIGHVYAETDSGADVVDTVAVPRMKQQRKPARITGEVGGTNGIAGKTAGTAGALHDLVDIENKNNYIFSLAL